MAYIQECHVIQWVVSARGLRLFLLGMFYAYLGVVSRGWCGEGVGRGCGGVMYGKVDGSALLSREWNPWWQRSFEVSLSGIVVQDTHEYETPGTGNVIWKPNQFARNNFTKERPANDEGTTFNFEKTSCSRNIVVSILIILVPIIGKKSKSFSQTAEDFFENNFQGN